MLIKHALNFRIYSTKEIRSTPQYSNLKLFKTRKPEDALITDFFGSVRQTVLFDQQVAPLNKTESSDQLTVPEQTSPLILNSVSQLPF